MADKRISELTLLTSPNQSDILPIVNGGSTKRIAYGSLYSDTRAGLVSGSYIPSSSYLSSGTIEYLQGIQFASESLMPSGEQRVTWNDTDGTLNVGLKGGNVSLQVGMESVRRVVNKTGQNLLESQYRVVKIQGAQGQRLAVDFAQATNDISSATTFGIVTEDIAVNQEGYITTAGKVREINTTGALQGETWNDGDLLYLSAVTPGVITNQKPLTPGHLVTLGYVVYAHPIHGIIEVKIDNGYEIEELHDVLITTSSLTTGSVLVYNGVYWENETSAPTASYLEPLVQDVQITGSIKISEVVNLQPQNPLPTGTIGDLAVSGSNLFFYNGTWTQVV